MLVSPLYEVITVCDGSESPRDLIAKIRKGSALLDYGHSSFFFHTQAVYFEIE